MEDDHFNGLLRKPIDDGREPSGKHDQNNLNISGMQQGFRTTTSGSYLTMAM